ncbi:MAG: hypothetical protein ACOYIF_05820 [Acetivibrionales bacterium]
MQQNQKAGEENEKKTILKRIAYRSANIHDAASYNFPGGGSRANDTRGVHYAIRHRFRAETGNKQSGR